MQDDRIGPPPPPRRASPLRLRNVAGAAGAVLAVAVAAVVVRLASASQPTTSAPRVDSPAKRATTIASSPSPSSSTPAAPSRVHVTPELEAKAELGRKIFFDETLSDPPGTSCASCHDPAHGYAGNNGSKAGTAQGSRPGHFARRNTPSVLYLKYVPRFAFRWEEDVNLPDAAGGFFWDGRVDSIAALVQQPLFNPNEMNARDAAQVAAKLNGGPYASEFRLAFGTAADDSNAAVTALGTAVEAFLESDAMAPFTSKYDDFVRGRASLAPLEAKGLALFKDRSKGACDACHRLSEASGKPERSLFTDFGFEAVGAPRNPRLAANRDAKTFDLGLCERHDHPHMDEERLCGAFRTPSLRNVAVRQSYMHNGAFSNLRDVVAFYATRGTDPKRWYASGAPFDDLPPIYRANVNADRVPYDRGIGEKPRLDTDEIDAIVAFLQTLTDAAYR
jgi:cytochrome c peroxidase